ncbi:unnamed protein product, partial [Porites evermanni]
PEWARKGKERGPLIGRPKEKAEEKPKTKPKPEWTKTSLRKKDTSKQADTQSEYWKEARPDWAKGKGPLSKTNEGTLKSLEKSKAAKDEIWEEVRPDWAKGKKNSPVVKPSAKDIRNIEEKKKYGYPTPEWTSRVRSKHKVRWTLFSSAEALTEKFKHKIHKAVEEENGKKSLLKAELENVLGKPKDRVVKRRHSSDDMSESYLAGIR